MTLGEARETVETIANAARRIARSLYYLKRGNVLGAAEQLLLDPKHHTLRRDLKSAGKDVSSQWLAMRYGWRPLLNDIWNAMGHLAYMFHNDVSRTFRVLS